MIFEIPGFCSRYCFDDKKINKWKYAETGKKNDGKNLPNRFSLRKILHSFTFAAVFYTPLQFTFAKFYIPLHLPQYGLRPFCSIPVCRHHSLFVTHVQNIHLYFAT